MTPAPLLALLLVTAEAPPDPTKAGMVTLDFRERTIQEVANAIGQRSGNLVNLQFVNENDPAPRRVTLLAPEPVPFWEAIDRLCDAADLQRSLNDGGPLGGRQASVALHATKVVLGPAVYSGPFRFGKFTLRATYEHRYVPASPDPNSADREGRRAEFEVLTEPRVIAIRTGPLRKLEATDDRGQSLLDPSADPEIVPGLIAGYGLNAYQPILRIRLARPDPQSRRLKVLRGVMPVEVGISPREPTLTIPLADSAGKSFEAGDLRFTIEEFGPRPGGSTYLKVRAKIEGPRGPSGPSPKSVVWARSAAIQRLVEVVDARGQNLTSGAGGSSAADELQFNYTFSPMPGGKPGSVPAQLRIYSPEWILWDAPFEFADMPLP